LSDEINNIETNKQLTEQQITEPETIQAYASCSDLQQLYLNTNYPNGLNSFANFTIPKDYRNQVKKAKELRQYSIAKKLIDIRKDYSLPIKEFRCKSKRQQKFYNEMVLPLVQRFARQFTLERYSVGEVFPHYGFKSDKKTPMFLRSESAEDIKPISALGYEIYEIQISPDLKSQIKKLQKQKAIDKLPEYLRNAIDNEGYVQDKTTLDYSSMYRVAEDKADYENRVKPPLLNIFKQLTLREFLLDMDYASAFSLQKNSVIHVKVGSTQQPEKDDKKIKAIHDVVTNRPPSSSVITTRGDVSIEAVDTKVSDLFDPKRFQQCNADIMDFFGLPTVFVPSKSEGINNTTVIVSLKSFEQSIQTDRQIFEEFLNVYFNEINRRNNFNEKIEVKYKHTNIRDNNELIKELQFLKDCGILAWEDICLEFDYDRDDQLIKKKFDWANRDDEAPTFENSQGLEPVLNATLEQKIKIAKETKQQSNEQNNKASIGGDGDG
jgi:hypothetical protein